MWSLVQRAIRENLRWELEMLAVPPLAHVVVDVNEGKTAHVVRTATESEVAESQARKEAHLADINRQWGLEEPPPTPGGLSGRPRKLTPEVLREVLILHRKATDWNAPAPREFVIHQLKARHPDWGDISPRTASRWIKAASESAQESTEDK